MPQGTLEQRVESLEKQIESMIAAQLKFNQAVQKYISVSAEKICKLEKPVNKKITPFKLK